MLDARNGARGDPGTALQVLRGDARQGNAAHLITCVLPRLARNAQHGRLAGAGIADDNPKIVLVRHMNECGALLS